MGIVASTAGVTASGIQQKAKLDQNASKWKVPQKPPNFNSSYLRVSLISTILQLNSTINKKTKQPPSKPHSRYLIG